MEISIPKVSTEAEGKPHTVYHISLKLSVRSISVKKRYNEFDILHNELVAAVGKPPPESLPRKQYLSSTLSNSALAEDRRVQLEKYIRAIMYDEDSRWRDSPVWRTFLNLPVERNSALRAEKYKEGENWLNKHRNLVEMLQEARMQLVQRNASIGTSLQQQAGKEARKLLVTARSCIDDLQSRLDSQSVAGEGELRRRRDLVLHAKSDLEALERLALDLALTPKSGLPASEEQKKDLFNGNRAASPSFRQGRVLGPKETDRTRTLGNRGVFQLQTTIMQEQDEQLAQLERILARQKELGVQIRDELESQNELLNDIEGDVDRTAGKIKLATKKADRLK